MAAAVQQYGLSSLGERLRQAGLYVDFHAGEKRWASPEEVSEHDTRLWLDRLEPSLARVEHIAGLGFFAAEALAIQRDVLGPINADRPKRKDLSAEDCRRIRNEGLVAHREYYRRLVEAEIVSQDADIQIMGVPLAEFIAEA